MSCDQSWRLCPSCRALKKGLCWRHAPDPFPERTADMEARKRATVAKKARMIAKATTGSDDTVTCPNGFVCTRGEVERWRLTMPWWRVPLFPDDDVEALRASAPQYLAEDPDVFPVRQ